LLRPAASVAARAGDEPTPDQDASQPGAAAGSNLPRTADRLIAAIFISHGYPAMTVKEKWGPPGTRSAAFTF
jgi:hypothetical protein